MPTKKTKLTTDNIPKVPTKTEETTAPPSEGFFNDDVNATPVVETPEDADDELPLQAPKVKPKPEPKPRVKRPQTEAQKAATAKMKAALAANVAKRKAEKAAIEAAHKKAMEERILKKAVSIKKKQIKAEQTLDVISDDDTPIEEIIPLVKKRAQPAPRQPAYVAAPPQPPRPRIIFM